MQVVLRKKIKCKREKIKCEEKKIREYVRN